MVGQDNDLPIFLLYHQFYCSIALRRFVCSRQEGHARDLLSKMHYSSGICITVIQIWLYCIIREMKLSEVQPNLKISMFVWFDMKMILLNSTTTNSMLDISINPGKGRLKKDCWISYWRGGAMSVTPDFPKKPLNNNMGLFLLLQLLIRG